MIRFVQCEGGNGNLTNVLEHGSVLTTTAYDKENRLSIHAQNAGMNTFTYDGDGLKRSEALGASKTTLVWDGSDYLGEVG
jgi:hypothetical protein